MREFATSADVISQLREGWQAVLTGVLDAAHARRASTPS
ncbi:hypothetical protein BJ963_002759 [Leifsonia soli]|uniref:Uncharacterized protein n=1 Tax=Leifsonia soli TaxID=582665 RepID=A0A852T3Z1_9MICO|nr:hypothetical protein [Leifsonia soli]